MCIQFNNLPANSRIWIYQSSRAFTEEEMQIITKKAIEFTNQWTRHGDDLKGSFTIKYKQFLILAVDESFATVSGCSIDSSVRFIKQLEDEFQLELMNKMVTAFKDGNQLNLVTLTAFNQLVKEHKITEKTIVFNNMVATKQDFETKWEVPAEQSWHKRFLN